MPTAPARPQPVPTTDGHGHADAQADAQADGLALADGFHRQGLHEAIEQLSAAEADTGSGWVARLCQAHKGMAIALSRLRAYSPAQSHLTQALHWAKVMGAADVRADLHCAMAEVATSGAEQARAHGASPERLRPLQERCRELAHEAARLATQTADPQWEIRLLLRASDVLARCGEHDDAAQLQHQALLLLDRQAPVIEDDFMPTVGSPAPDDWRATAPGGFM